MRLRENEEATKEAPAQDQVRALYSDAVLERLKALERQADRLHAEAKSDARTLWWLAVAALLIAALAISRLIGA